MGDKDVVDQRVCELTAVNRVLAAGLSALDPQHILHTACETLADALDLPQANGAWFGGESGSSSGEGGLVPPDAVGSRPWVLSGAAPRPALVPLAELMEQRRIASLLIVPLVVQEEVAGVIELPATEQHKFSNRDLELAKSVAHAVGQIMETVKEHQKLQRYANSLEETAARRTFDLRTERDRTRSILEALGEAVVVTDVEGMIQYINPAAAALTGYKREQVWGKRWNMWYRNHQQPDFYQQIEQVARSGETWRGEVFLKRQDGTFYDVAMTMAPLFDLFAPGRPIGFVSVQRDITPLKEAERLKDEFVSNVSHELRTPLSVITLLSGNLDTLYGQLDDASRRGMVQNIRQNARLLNALISDLLDVSRIDSGKISTQRQATDLAHLVHEEADKQRPLVKRKSQTLRVIGGAPLPVMGNQNQLRQVIRNLLNNAIKYTFNNGLITCECVMHVKERPGEVDLEAIWPGHAKLPAGRWAAFRVVDTGIGIGQDDLPRIFERFYRTATQGNIPGTGLGLSIAQKLVELHDGRIAVASNPGVGSVFAVYLPLLEE